MKKAQVFAVGDRVAYTAAWLRATGNQVGQMGFLRGTVTGVEPFGGDKLVAVSWADGIDVKVLDWNLTLASRVGVDSALTT